MLWFAVMFISVPVMLITDTSTSVMLAWILALLGAFWYLHYPGKVMYMVKYPFALAKKVGLDLITGTPLERAIPFLNDVRVFLVSMLYSVKVAVTG